MCLSHVAPSIQKKTNTTQITSNHEDCPFEDGPTFRLGLGGCWLLCISVWWFGTFFICPSDTGNNHPNWLICIRDFQKNRAQPPTRFSIPSQRFAFTSPVSPQVFQTHLLSWSSPWWLDALDLCLIHAGMRCHRCGIRHTLCTLWWTNIAMENHFWWKNSLKISWTHGNFQELCWITRG